MCQCALSPDAGPETDAATDPVLHGLSLPEGVDAAPAGHEEVLLRRQNQPRQGLWPIHTYSVVLYFCV